MTRDRDFKQLVRARMGRTGESYTAARSRLRRRGQAVMTRQELETLPDGQLVARSAAPLARGMQVADPAARRAFLRRLTADQGALLALWIVVAHAQDGLTGFAVHHPHRMADDDFWTLLHVGLRRLGDGELLSLLGRLRSEVAGALAEGTLAGLDPEAMQPLDEEYDRLLPRSLRRAAKLVRDRSRDFVSLEG